MKFSLAASLFLAASVSAQNVVDVAVSLPETFSTLVDLVTAADLVDALSTTEDITVFAPTNDAFGQLDATVVSNLQTEQWKLHLQDTLLYHVVPSVVPASAITEETTATALNGENITAAPAEGTVVINDSASVVQADVEADNGLIHVSRSAAHPFHQIINCVTLLTQIFSVLLYRSSTKCSFHLGLPTVSSTLLLPPPLFRPW
jgi:uncharacterized surface protein with fasciclin (FAS1) repeats